MKKKIISIAMLLGITALLTACGKKEASPADYVKLGEYTNLVVDRIVSTVTDDDIQYEIDNELSLYSETKEIKDRPAKKGDTVVVDFVGYLGDEEIEGGSENNCEILLGSDEFIDGFEDGIVGMKVNDTKDVKVTFPEEYDGELDGKEATFRITLHSITEVITPEFDDAFVKENLGFDSVEAYKASVRDSLQMDYDNDASYMAAYDALAIAVDNADMQKYPENLLADAIKKIEEDAASFAEQFGMTLEDLYGEDYDPEEDAKTQLKERFVVEAIAKKENLLVSDKEYDEYVDSVWEMYGYESKEDYEQNVNKEDAIYELVYEKVLDFLKEHNKFNDISEEEYYGTEDAVFDFDEDGYVVDEVEFPEGDEALFDAAEEITFDDEEMFVQDVESAEDIDEEDEE